MDPLRFTIAVVPLAAWLAVVGLLQIRRRPTVVSGASDLFALGLALSGFVLVGPLALFRPEAATAQFGNYIWIFLLAFYWLWIMLAAMTVRPRIVVYNATPDQVRPLLADAAAELDPQFRWAGDALLLPTIGVQLHIEYFRLLRNTSLVATGTKQELAAWRALLHAVHERIGSVAPATSPWGPVMIGVAILLTTAGLLAMTSDLAAVAEARRELLSFVPSAG